MNDMQVAAISLFFDKVLLAIVAFCVGWFFRDAQPDIARAKAKEEA